MTLHCRHDLPSAKQIHFPQPVGHAPGIMAYSWPSLLNNTYLIHIQFDVHHDLQLCFCKVAFLLLACTAQLRYSSPGTFSFPQTSQDLCQPIFFFQSFQVPQHGGPVTVYQPLSLAYYSLRLYCVPFTQVINKDTEQYWPLSGTLEDTTNSQSLVC